MCVSVPISQFLPLPSPLFVAIYLSPRPVPSFYLQPSSQSIDRRESYEGRGVGKPRWRIMHLDFWHWVEMTSNSGLIYIFNNSFAKEKPSVFTASERTGPMWTVQFSKVVKAQ